VADAVNAADMPAVECRPTPVFARLGQESLLATVFFVAGRLS